MADNKGFKIDHTKTKFGIACYDNEGKMTNFIKTNDMAENKEFQWTDSAALQFIGFYMAKRDNPDFNDTELVSDFKTRIMENASQSKQVKGGRDWEIVSLKHNGSGSILESTIIPQILESKDYRNSPIYSIHSVKRLSDGEVFNIGDAAYDLCLKGIIKRIYIDEKGQCIVECSNVIPTGNDFIRIISQIHLDKAPEIKEPLFVNEDGVKIFDDDKYWVVRENFTIGECVGGDFSGYNRPDKHLRKRYSTYKKAEEYILLNRACLSYREVMDIVHKVADGAKGHDNKSYIRDQLYELAQSKLQ